MAWQSVLLTDLDGQGVGELSNLYDRSLSWRNNRVATSHFAVRLDDPLADRLLELDLLVKHYKDDELWAVHEITDLEEVVEGNSKRIGVTCQDPFWRFAGRLIGKSQTGYNPGFIARGAAVQALLTEVNAIDFTGVTLGTLEATTSDFIGPLTYKGFAETILELSAPLDGFDFVVRPVEPVVLATAGTVGLKIAELDILVARGALQPHAVFAYSDDEDDRGNLRMYRRAISKATMLNVGYSLPQGWPDTAAGNVQAWSDATSRARWHWREGVVPGDVGDDALRLKLVQEHVEVRKNPRETIVIAGYTPAAAAELAAEHAIHVPSSPVFGEDFDVGDVVPLRATVDGQSRFNGQVRIYGVDLSIDELGRETPTLSVTPE